MNNNNVCVVVSTVDNNEELLSKMNINSDAIVINQTNIFQKREIMYKKHKIKWFDFDERGIGLSRNNGISRVDKEFCVLSDDDVIFEDNYQEKVNYWFSVLPKADVLIFNFKSKNHMIRTNDKIVNIHKFNYYNYGAPRIVFRTNTVRLKGIFFNLSFGGGTTFSSGEDTLFLSQLLKFKLKIYAVPDSISDLTNDRPSTWFKGYNEKYFFDKGVLLSLTNPHCSRIIAIILLLKNRKIFCSNFNFFKCLKYVLKGIRFIKREKYRHTSIDNDKYYLDL